MGNPGDTTNETLDAAATELADEFDDDDDLNTETPLTQFLEELRDADETNVRSVGQYDGKDSSLLFVRDDLEDEFDEATRTQYVENIALKALGDPIDDPAFEAYGTLDAVLRWFDDVVVATYPHDEWSGAFATFDRSESELVDNLVDAF